MEPDSDFDPRGFAESWWRQDHLLVAFEDHLLCGGDNGFDFSGVRTDWYDSSVEIDGVPPDMRLSDAQQRLLYDCGFLRCWLNHQDMWETYYAWPRDEFELIDGRRIDKRPKC